MRSRLSMSQFAKTVVASVATVSLSLALLINPADAANRLYAVSQWRNKFNENIDAFACNMQHTRINAPDWYWQGLVGEVMWVRSYKTFADGNNPWVEVGWSDGGLESNWFAGHCFYWAERDDDGSYHDVRLWDDNDPDLSDRWYIIQNAGGNNWDVVISDTTYTKFYLVGTATNINGPLKGSDHGLEVTSTDSRSVFNGSHATALISNIQCRLSGVGWFANDNVYFNITKKNSVPANYGLENNNWDATWNYGIF